MRTRNDSRLYVKPITKTMKFHVVSPTDVYKALKLQTNSPNSYLLESCEGDVISARYSFLGVNPIGRIVIRNSRTEVMGKTFSEINKDSNDPIKTLESSIGKTEVLHSGKGSRFIGGAVGYFSYDIIRYYLKYLENKKTDLLVPDAEFLFTKDVVVFDHLIRELEIVCCALGKDEFELHDDLAPTEDRIRDIEEIILSTEKCDVNFSKPKPLNSTSDTSKEEYMSMVERSKEFIREGDIFQVVISKRATVGAQNPFTTYLALKNLNPSPYLFLLEFGDLAVIGSSPEMLVRVDGSRVITRPIAGTRKRGVTELMDRNLTTEMMNDPKERAEHIMLVDLHRNDLGRVCKYGSVTVSELMEVVRYSHVQHIVSTVEGELDPKYSPCDALRSLFPAGTVSGAPKVRAMEIINDLELQRRGAYAGAVGYFSLDGNLDFAITIRTIIQKLNKAYVQAGSGIVADSVPEKEWYESESKAAALIQAISMVS